jgi:FixJ family two-component response regulator
VQHRSDSLTVYVVDDDDSVLRSLSRLLTTSGFQVQAFSSAETFLKSVRADSQGCVLLDVTMPRISGLQVQAALKERGIKLPVIAISARESHQIRETARELGAQFFLHKPVDDQALLDAIAWVTQRADGSTGTPVRPK